MLTSNCIKHLNLDIKGIVETHLRNDDMISIDGCKWIGHNRKNLHRSARTGSGGEGFLIKEHICNLFDIDILDITHEGMLWIYLHHKFSDFKTIFCVCYLPPDNSTRQVDKDVFFL